MQKYRRVRWFVGALFLALACVAVAGGSYAQPIAGNAYIHSATLWPSTSIRVCWETEGYETEKLYVRNAIERTWERESGVDFTHWGACPSYPSPMPLSMLPMLYHAPANFRIRIGDEGPHTRGLGRQLQQYHAGMVLNFTFVNWPCPYARQQCIEAIAVHEFGHAMGFAHEQNRPDTPAWCREPQQGADGDRMIGPWDANSVMNYCHNSYSNYGALSAVDIQAARAIYGPPR